ncbi:MAG: serine/threonine protein phosphatase [Actinobacteria bacterium]|nr:serine/threonine protein phosphatase [Actinomycetota bacterium]
MSRYFFAASSRSAVGLVRNGNEDSALIDSRVIAVADGMGGHAGGEVASATAINTLAKIIPVISSDEIDSDSAEDLFLNSLYSVDEQIKIVADEDPGLSGMGTTLTALFLQGESVALLHVGDSRAYRLRGSSIEQLSADHTVLQELISKGAISISEAADHPQRSILTQALMGEGNLEAALQLFSVEAKDRYLLCSDGLTGVLSEKEIKSLIKGKDRDEAISALIDATYINGAPDNVTVVIADVVESPETKLRKFGAAEA